MINIFYKNEYIFILIKKATNRLLLDCLFLCLKQPKIVLKIRSPPVLLLILKKLFKEQEI